MEKKLRGIALGGELGPLDDRDGIVDIVVEPAAMQTSGYGYLYDKNGDAIALITRVTVSKTQIDVATLGGDEPAQVIEIPHVEIHAVVLAWKLQNYISNKCSSL